jgi:predicted dehydrogenase
MIGYPSRFYSGYFDLKRKMETGALGDIQTAHAMNISAGAFLHRGEVGIPKPVPEWWLNKELTGGGALIDLGSHMINLARWYFGEVDNVKTYLGYRYNFDFEDHAICIINFKSGTTAIINVGWFSQIAKIGIELFGTVAHASAYYSSPNKVITAIQLLLGRTPRFFVPLLTEVSHFIRCINEDIQPLTSGEDALEDLETIERAYGNQILLD